MWVPTEFSLVGAIKIALINSAQLILAVALTAKKR